MCYMLTSKSALAIQKQNDPDLNITFNEGEIEEYDC